MTNPYDAPQSANDHNAPKPRRTGMWMLIGFLLIFGGCAASSLLFFSVSSGPAPLPPGPVQNAPVSAE